MTNCTPTPVHEQCVKHTAVVKTSGKRKRTFSADEFWLGWPPGAQGPVCVAKAVVIEGRREWVLSLFVRTPTCGSEPTVGDARPIFQRGCTVSKCWQLVGVVFVGAVSTLAYKAQPAAHADVRNLLEKVKNMENERKRLPVEFDELEEDTVPEDYGMMEVDDETDSGKKLEMRKRDITRDTPVRLFFCQLSVCDRLTFAGVS